MNDLRFAVRQLLKSPGFSILAILTLAIGIGMNTAIFSVVNAVLLRPLPYRDSEHLLAVSLVHQQSGPRGSPLSPADFLDFRAQNRTFQFAAFQDDTFNYAGQTPEQIAGAITTADFFSVLGVNPLLGRGFLPNEDQPGAERVAVLSEHFWRTHFNADPQLIGRPITLESRPYTVVGVMPASFQFPNARMEVWVPYQLQPPTRRGPYFLRGLVRYPAAMSLEQARGELSDIAARVKRSVAELPPTYGYVSTPLNDWIVGEVRPALLVLLGAVACVLLIASVNVANLLLSRAVAREREIAIRSALGASRARIVRQFLSENLLLAGIGGVAGLLLSIWGVDVLRTFGPDNVPRLADVRVDRAMLIWTGLVSLASGLFFGVAPAWHGTRTNLNDSLKSAGRTGSESSASRRLRSALVVTEVALAMMLLIGAGLLIRSFVRLQRVDPGVASRQVVTMNVPLTRAHYPELPQVVSFYDRLLQRVNALPGVESAAITSSLPPNGLQVSDTFLVEGMQPVDDSKAPLGAVLMTTPGYFHTLGVSVREGRDFDQRDTATSPRVVIISETLARKFFPDQSPIGRRFHEGGTDRASNPWLEIVGVVGDVKYEGLATATAPAFYLPFAQSPIRDMSLVVRTTLPAASVASSVRAELATIDREVPVAKVGTIEELVNASVAQPRFRTFLIAAFSTVAMALAAIGIYGVIGYTVSQRTHELGIRIALGAKRRDVMALVVRHGIALTVAGILLGGIGSLALTRVTANLLFGVGAFDPPTFISIAVLLIVVALLACWIPARRASRVDPIIALRAE